MTMLYPTDVQQEVKRIQQEEPSKVRNHKILCLYRAVLLELTHRNCPDPATLAIEALCVEFPRTQLDPNHKDY